jgi:hypothetical protein
MFVFPGYPLCTWQQWCNKTSDIYPTFKCQWINSNKLNYQQLQFSPLCIGHKVIATHSPSCVTVTQKHRQVQLTIVYIQWSGIVSWNSLVLPGFWTKLIYMPSCKKKIYMPCTKEGMCQVQLTIVYIQWSDIVSWNSLVLPGFWTKLIYMPCKKEGMCQGHFIFLSTWEALMRVAHRNLSIMNPISKPIIISTRFKHEFALAIHWVKIK